MHGLVQALGDKSGPGRFRLGPRILEPTLDAASWDLAGGNVQSTDVCTVGQALKYLYSTGFHLLRGRCPKSEGARMCKMGILTTVKNMMVLSLCVALNICSGFLSGDFKNVVKSKKK